MQTLQDYLQNPNHTFEYPNDITAKFILFGKDEFSRIYSGNSPKNNPDIETTYCISEVHDLTNPHSDISIHYLHNYEEIIQFVNTHFGITYKELECMFQTKEAVKCQMTPNKD